MSGKVLLVFHLPAPLFPFSVLNSILSTRLRSQDHTNRTLTLLLLQQITIELNMVVQAEELDKDFVTNQLLDQITPQVSLSPFCVAW